MKREMSMSLKAQTQVKSPTNSFKSPFAGIEEVEVVQRNGYVEPGKHTLRVNKVELLDSEQKGQFFIVEFEVVESNSMEIGTMKTWMMKTSLFAFKANAKAFISAAGGIGLDEVTEDISTKVIGPEQPLSNALVKCEARLRDKKQGDGQYTYCVWSAVDGQA
jgi:hypothetical protein